jgi:hypothetical protein
MSIILSTREVMDGKEQTPHRMMYTEADHFKVNLLCLIFR